jgi:hypothetical protein
MWPLKHGVVLFPSRPEEFGTDADLVGEIRSFLHRYVDLNPVFEQIAAYYVLCAWVYDRFNELPYLRVPGDAGSGKRRFLLTVGSLPVLLQIPTETEQPFRLKPNTDSD